MAQCSKKKPKLEGVRQHFGSPKCCRTPSNWNTDLAVIVASIAYNTWFTKLHCKDMRIGSEVVDQVLHTVSKSNTLEELTLENAGLKSDFPQKMASALSENPASVIHSLNLAHNTLDNQGVSNLIQQVCRLNKGLRLLNLSKTSLSSKGVVTLSQALCSSDDYSNSLLHLDLSKNPGVLSGEDATNLYLFLAQPNCLVHLDLSGTDCTVDSDRIQAKKQKVGFVLNKNRSPHKNNANSQSSSELLCA
ncbi:leucine-rich repeat-containing protein 16B-like [Notothenia coriiceps]|uniref:Leucine-rich repeat-containing protein 16B-like n=1 Tax=Notothenia coriiceps TaxID=8208 RepID=A0A6I9MX23_9TELE|nr:PREDICTED: leucine-rich repeat-containing protein 16B-like [Notothenia coriiceps]